LRDPQVVVERPGDRASDLAAEGVTRCQAAVIAEAEVLTARSM
jgi:hypothetical protein